MTSSQGLALFSSRQKAISSQIIAMVEKPLPALYIHRKLLFCCARQMISRLLISAPPCVGNHRMRYFGMSS